VGRLGAAEVGDERRNKELARAFKDRRAQKAMGGVVVIEAKKGAVELLSRRSLSHLHLGTRIELMKLY
jgi:hypothetical protein